MADIEVGLLNGLNCPSALRSREIVYGEESDPYAVRLLLGWYVNDPLYISQQSGKIKCNRIHVGEKDTLGYVPDPSRICSLAENGEITPQAVRQMCELDFSEREKGTVMSREDIKFCIVHAS